MQVILKKEDAIWTELGECKFKVQTEYSVVEIKPFSKGWYQVLLPTQNGNWYLLILKSVV